MHLTNELQQRLDKLGSKVKLEAVIDGSFPEKYSFLHKQKRNISTAFAASQNEFSILLNEKTDQQGRTVCFARGLFNSIERLAEVIDLWAGKEVHIYLLKDHFQELELYKDLEPKLLDKDIEIAWSKLKNQLFKRVEFWTQREWEINYLNLINEARSHHAFRSYFPFTSHDSLCFSLNKEISETWGIGIHIFPPYDASNGKFYVSYQLQPMQGDFFEDAKAALDIYAEKLKGRKPTKWI